jgi:hypothetical protein
VAIADKLIRKVEIRLDGADWPLVVTHDVLIECERLTGKKMLAGGEALRPTARLVRALLCIMLRRAGATLTVKEIGQLITPGNAEQIHSKIIDAWAASMPEPKPDVKTPSSERAKPFDAIEAWAIGRYDLGLTDQEWLDSTPRQIDELQKRKRERRQYEEWLMAVVAASASNAPHWRTSQPRAAREFMTMYPPDPEIAKPISGIGMVRAAFARFPKKRAA